MSEQLEQLYQEAKSAFQRKEYDRAADLIRKILLVDEDYKDASRLLAQIVKLRRRRWHNHPLLWSSIGLAAIIALGSFIAPRMKDFNAAQPSATVVIGSPTATLPPTAAATETLLPAPTPLPLAWKRISLGQEFERDSVTAFATDRNDPDVIYAAMRNSGVYKTIDGGLSWQPAHLGLASAQVESLLIDTQNPRILYASTMGGVFKTEDGGENWFRIGEGTRLLMDAQDNSHLYARDEDGIYETIDRGENWETVYSSAEDCPGKIQSWAIHPTESGRLFITGEKCAGVYQSGSSGKTWDLMGVEEITNITSLTVGIDEEGATFIYALSEGGWYESSDGGATWSTIGILAYQITVLTADVEIPSISYIASVTSIYIRRGRGAWQRIPNSQSRMYSAIHIDHPNGATRILSSATDVSKQSSPNVGIFISTDDGASWVEQDNGIGSARSELTIDPIKRSRMYLAGYYVEMNEGAGCGLYRSLDGGTNWETIVRHAWTPPSWCGPTFDPAHTLYLMETGRMQISANGGDTWLWKSGGGSTGPDDPDETLAYALPNFFRDGYYFEGSQSLSANPFVKGYIYDVGDMIYYSPDLGVNWQLSQGSEGSWDARLFYTDQSQTIYAIGRDHQTFSTDNGMTWQNCGEDVIASRSDSRLALTLDGSRLYLATPGKGVLVSTDNCQSWQASNEGLGNLFVNTLAIDPNDPNKIYAGTDGGAYISYDAGLTWGQVNDGLLGATVVYSIAVDKDSNVYAATPYGIFKLESK